MSWAYWAPKSMTRTGRGEFIRQAYFGALDPIILGTMATVGKILVGTASWTDKTLLDSGWYPADADNPEKRLAYYAEQFPLVEVDATYYHPPPEATAAAWAARTPKDFVFNIKAFSLLTGHPTKVSAIFKD